MAAVAEEGIALHGHQFPHRQAPSSPPSPPSPDPKADFKSDVRKLVDLLSKLNPSAEEFVPSSESTGRKPRGLLAAGTPVFVAATGYRLEDTNPKGSGNKGSQNNHRRKRNSSDQGRRRRVNERVLREQREDSIRRTVYVSDVDVHVTEEQLAGLFTNCGQVREVDVKAFFEACCGKVSRLRLLGDHVHSTRIAFVEFVQAEGALGALNCSGMLLGTLPIRVSPSKTPVRPCVPPATKR